MKCAARKNDANNRHLGTIVQVCRAESSQLKHVSTMGKLVKQQYLLHMSPQYGELRPTSRYKICWQVWGTQANWFLVLTSLLQRRRSPEASQTLHDVCPSPGLVHYVYTFGSYCPMTEFRHVQNSLCVLKSCVLLYWQRYCTALQQRAQPNFAAWYKE